MSINMYFIIYLICNLFQTYIVYKLFHVFFTEIRTNNKTEYITYLGFFVINSSLYYIFSIPLINVLINLLGFFLLTLNYKSNLRKRIMCVILVYLIMGCVELVFSCIFSDTRMYFFSSNTYESIYIPISTTLFLYVISLVLGQLINIKNHIKIPHFYWVMLAGIPFASLYMLFLILQSQDISLQNITILSALILFINFSTFFLYDMVIAELVDKIEKTLLKQVNMFYDNQLKQMETSLISTRRIQHDIKNHFIAIHSFAKHEENHNILDYLKEIQNSTESRTAVLSTGNIVVDSILNFKIQEAEQMSIQIQTSIAIPSELNISSFDLVIILGNLLDNAIAAVNKLPKKEPIQCKMIFNEGKLLIKIVNVFSGILNEKNGRFITQKDDKNLHGLGLENVEDIIKNYDGQMDFDYNNNTFSVIIIMYIK